MSVHRGGVCLSACWDSMPPQDQADPPWDQADPLGPGRHYPGTRQTPPGPGRPPRDQADTPWDQADTPQDQADTPGPGRHPPGPGRYPPRKQTPAYGLRAAGTHPTGMHSCYNFSCKKNCPNPTAVSECRSLLVKLLSHPVNEIRSRVYQACCSCIKVRLLPVDYVLYRMAASASMLKVGFKCILINSTN